MNLASNEEAGKIRIQWPEGFRNPRNLANEANEA
jgi:hypothetical protein